MEINNPIFTYKEFFEWMQSLAKAGKTSGDDQTQVLADFTALNCRRMSRLNKTLILNDELKKALDTISEVQEWIVITEAWCGDSAQNLPLIAKMADFSDTIELKIILRNKNPELMEKYLTNGSKSIPKLIVFNKSGKELFAWGPRPVPAQALLEEWKREPAGRNWEAFETELHTWYARDKARTIQQEFIEIFKNL
ncbi:thioredoxin family protein [Christiangramia fulva]|uniref:Thioredoxin family protein n=1 Tax=Christiangramia fulva TaxID=2126553 RepID=A0A2R3Z491_9FLAO|nr:thioredoxin family protein [Christiangramia fulva]AVR45085.1 thioredoxin family protein [Christiangramia fulva]